MSGLINITVQEARGPIAVPANIDRTPIVIGCSSAGSGLSNFFLSATSAITALGYGDAVDVLTQNIEQRQDGGSGTKLPAAFYTVPGSTPGAYGTIDIADVVGTCRPANDESTEPYGTYEAAIQWVDACTVGTTGGTYRWSLDAGRTWSNVTALGTATNIAIPRSAVAFELEPPTTALYASVNALKATVLAHMILTSGTVHGAADTVNNGALTAIPAATTYATAITLYNAIITYLSAHVVLTAGAVHGASDTTAATALGALTPATTAQEVVTGLPTLIAIYNAHRIKTSSSVHGAADSTNVAAASTATHGTLLAGDTWGTWTSAPAPSASDIDAAATALAAASVDFGLIYFAFDVDAAMAAHVTSMLNTLSDVGKRPTACIQVRPRDFSADETEVEWFNSVAADFASYTDSRVCKRASYGFVTDAVTGRIYLRADFACFTAEVTRVGRSVWPDSPNSLVSGIPLFTLIDAAGETIGHDEGPQGAITGLSDPDLGNTFSCVQRLAVAAAVRQNVYNCVPWVSYDTGERIQTLMVRRIANAFERTMILAEIPTLGARLAYVSTGATSGTLTPTSVKLVQGAVFAACSSEFSTEIDNAQNADLNNGLIQVDPTVIVAPGKLLTVAVTGAPDVGGYVQTINNTFAVQL